MKRVIALLFLSLIPVFVLAQRTEGTANAHLNGRNVVGTLPRPSYNAQLEGIVVVQVKVDQYGNVTEAVPGVEGTTVTDSGLWNTARNAAMKVHFNANASAPTIQIGTISYNFLKSKRSLTSLTESLGYDHLRFKEVEIDGNYMDYARKLEEKGCVITNSSEKGVLMRGSFMGYPDVLIVLYPDPASKDVVSVGAFLRSSDNWNSIESTFMNAVETYKKKYGEPWEFTTEFEDGLIDAEYFKKQYIEDEKCHYEANWYFEEGGITIGIKYVNKQYGVLIQYIDSQNTRLRESHILDEI